MPPVIIILLACITAFKSIGKLNVGRNQFSGSLPPSLFAPPHLKFLDLSFNNFEGPFPISLSSEPVPLEVLCLSGNNLSGALPTEQETGLEGKITPSLCKLVYLRIIDLAHNKLSGSLPSCIGNISFNGDTDDQFFAPAFWASDSYNSFYGLRDFTFATKGNFYTYGRSFFVLMSGIDLSANMLDGEIPRS